MTQESRPTLVTGAGGFIHGHLIAELLNRSTEVRTVDVKPLDEWLHLTTRHGTAVR
jgi:GDP-D-mannose 3',5'-epimerase